MTHSINDIRRFIDESDNFTLVGLPAVIAANWRLHANRRSLESSGKRVANLVDASQMTAQDVTGRKVIVSADIDSTQIVRTLVDQYQMKPFEDFIHELDFFYLAEKETWVDGTAREFKEYFTVSVSEYLQAYECFDDHKSRDTFYKTLRYRLLCCELETLRKTDYPFSLAEYVAAEKRYAQYRNSGVVTSQASEHVKHHVAWFLAQETFNGLTTSHHSEDESAVIDWGANVGETAATLAYLLPGSAIHAFEPSEEAFGKLMELAGLVPRILPVKVDGRDLGQFSIDEYVKARELRRIAAINLRMENTGLVALLEGASRTIDRDQPNLCIRVDERRNDLWEVPVFLKAHFPGYRLSFQHQGAHIFGSSILATAD